ncbi:MAG TPA: RsmG family class I SAM-dependent methyltransferase [Gaiellaceae bacterium]|nr:RsmG family class I SAM-dependent methyltransferase [Gaiellaceae bacterium]
MTAADPRLGRWLEAVLAEPGLTAVRDPGEARRVLVDDALASAGLVEEGPVVDVGSGGGSPGIPLAAARPELHVDLLEGQRRKCSFLERAATAFANVGVVCARAEEHGRGAGREAYGTAVAQALAPPPVALEWCLPLVRTGGRVILLAGEVDLARAAAAAAVVGGGVPEEVPLPGGEHRRLLVVPKIAPTPARFPRRPGMARKRPLA